MENEVLKDIVDYAANRLNTAYGYCGVAEGSTVVMINSDDRRGHDIKISIEIEDE